MTPNSQPAPSLSLKDHITLILIVGMQVSQKRVRVARGSRFEFAAWLDTVKASEEEQQQQRGGQAEGSNG